MKWISVKDRLPKNTGHVLVCNYDQWGHYHSYTVAYYSTKKKWVASSDMLEAHNYDGGAGIYLDDVVTHWAEIEPPKEEIL